MSTTETPDGWHWGIGEASDHYYDHWLYTDKVLYQDEDAHGSKFGCEIHLFWDKGGEHCIEVIPITRLLPNGDLEYDYPCYSRQFDTRIAAERTALRKARKLR